MMLSQNAGHYLHPVAAQECMNKTNSECFCCRIIIAGAKCARKVCKSAYSSCLFLLVCLFFTTVQMSGAKISTARVMPWKLKLKVHCKHNLFFMPSLLCLYMHCNFKNWGGFFLFLSYYIQHCFICRPSDFSVPTDAGIEPRTVATDALTVRRSNH
jgi:hypothetical protein